MISNPNYGPYRSIRTSCEAEEEIQKDIEDYVEIPSLGSKFFTSSSPD